MGCAITRGVKTRIRKLNINATLAMLQADVQGYGFIDNERENAFDMGLGEFSDEFDAACVRGALAEMDAQGIDIRPFQVWVNYYPVWMGYPNREEPR